MQETQDQLDDFRAFWLAAGADEVLFKGYTTWGDQTADFVELAVPSARKAHHRDFPCSFLWESLVIAWNGRVVPCCYDYDAKSTMGDLNTHSLWEIWNGEAYRTLRRMELDGSNNTPLCSNCSQAPGHPQNPLWPIPLQVQRTVSRA